MVERFNQINNLEFEALIDLVKKYKNINIILKLNNLDKLEENKKIEFYTAVIEGIEEIDTVNKIKLLIMLNLYNIDINKLIINNLNNENDEKAYIEYVNKVNIFDDYTIKYFIEIPRVYKLNTQNIEEIKKYDNEKYLIYKSFNEGKLDDNLIKDKVLLNNIFVTYKELTDLFNNNLEAINILISSKTYLKLNPSDINDKIMVFANAKQTKDLISFILDSEIINVNIKSDYFSKINILDSETAKYLYDELIAKRNGIFVVIKKAIYENRSNIFKEISKGNKKSIAMILSNDINKEG